MRAGPGDRAPLPGPVRAAAECRARLGAVPAPSGPIRAPTGPCVSPDSEDSLARRRAPVGRRRPRGGAESRARPGGRRARTHHGGADEGRGLPVVMARSSSPMVVRATTRGRHVEPYSMSAARSRRPNPGGASAYSGSPRTTRNRARKAGTSSRGRPSSSRASRSNSMPVTTKKTGTRKPKPMASTRARTSPRLAGSAPRSTRRVSTPAAKAPSRMSSPKTRESSQHGGEHQHHEPDGELPAGVQGPLDHLGNHGRRGRAAHHTAAAVTAANASRSSAAPAPGGVR